MPKFTKTKGVKMPGTYTKKPFFKKASAVVKEDSEYRRIITGVYPQESHKSQETVQGVVTDQGRVYLYKSQVNLSKSDIGKTLVIKTVKGRGATLKDGKLAVFSEAEVSIEGQGNYTPPTESPADMQYEDIIGKTTAPRVSSSVGLAETVLLDVHSFLSADSTVVAFKTLQGLGYDQETIRTLLISLMIEARRSGK